MGEGGGWEVVQLKVKNCRAVKLASLEKFNLYTSQVSVLTTHGGFCRVA